MAKRKGFSVTMRVKHWVGARQAYCWLREKGAIEDMSSLLEMIPDVDSEDIYIGADWHTLWGYNGRRWKKLESSKAVRVRADKVETLHRWLVATASATVDSTLSGVLQIRAHELAKISPLDLLADAGR